MTFRKFIYFSFNRKNRNETIFYYKTLFHWLLVGGSTDWLTELPVTTHHTVSEKGIRQGDNERNKRTTTSLSEHRTRTETKRSVQTTVNEKIRNKISKYQNSKRNGMEFPSLLACISVCIIWRLERSWLAGVSSATLASRVHSWIISSSYVLYYKWFVVSLYTQRHYVLLYSICNRFLVFRVFHCKRGNQRTSSLIDTKHSLCNVFVSFWLNGSVCLCSTYSYIFMWDLEMEGDLEICFIVWFLGVMLPKFLLRLLLLKRRLQEDHQALLGKPTTVSFE